MVRPSGLAPARYPFRRHVQDVIDSKVFSAAMLTIIFVNTFLIALQTDQVAQMKAGECDEIGPAAARAKGLASQLSQQQAEGTLSG